MIDIAAIYQAFYTASLPSSVAIVFGATLLGIIVGMMPGLTATMGLALLTTLTFQMDSAVAIAALLSMYVGSIYGGSRTAILLNMPGTPASAATTLDGYALARSDGAKEALGIATIGSMFGTLIGIFLLLIMAPILSDYALEFGSYEFFWLALFGVIISGRLTATSDPVKGWIAGLLGLWVAMIGQEQIFSYSRFDFGYRPLTGGIGLIPAMVGAFGFVEILASITHINPVTPSKNSGKLLPSGKQLLTYCPTIVRSGIVGTIMGLIPGVGEDIGAWVSYSLARRFSNCKQKFGNGSKRGLIAAETGNSAAVPGAIIPVLTLAIPGSAPSAVLLAAIIIHGIQPGPLIMIQNADLVYGMVATLTFSAIAIAVLGVGLTTPLLTILRVRRAVLLPIIFVLCVIGAYAIAGREFDVLVMLVFGVVGFFLKKMHFPMAPLVLGLVLGAILDKSLRRGLVLSDGSIEPFFTRPISAVLAFVTIVTVVLALRGLRNK